MPSPAEIAVTVFNQHYNCSQSVFSAFAPQLGMDRETALKLASPFGGGVGYADALRRSAENHQGPAGSDGAFFFCAPVSGINHQRPAIPGMKNLYPQMAQI